MKNVVGLILGAGKGSRMNSNIPKILHDIGGRPIVSWVLSALRNAGCKDICLILGHKKEEFTPFLESEQNLAVCQQVELNGTGGAVAATSCLFKGVSAIEFAPGVLLQGEPIDPPEFTLIINGDLPALKSEELTAFCDFAQSSKLDVGVLGVELPDPSGYGRLILDGDNLQSIVEDKDASEQTKLIQQINSGVYLFRTHLLFDLLRKLNTDNAQNEFYLTDCIRLAKEENKKVKAWISKEWQSLLGVNTQEELKDLEDLFF